MGGEVKRERGKKMMRRRTRVVGFVVLFTIFLLFPM
jgi:hypothetical protein